jgi:hypothetical protein
MNKNLVLLITLLMLNHATQAAPYCPKTMSKTISSERYSLLNDGTEVLDKQTKLIWRRCPLGKEWAATQCTGAGLFVPWQQALIAAKATNQWRLPNVKEIESLTEYACSPMLNDVFEAGSSRTSFWTSTPNIALANEVWVVDFNAYYGGIYTSSINQKNPFMVVRSE